MDAPRARSTTCRWRESPAWAAWPPSAPGISGASWGPIGVKLLILLRTEPKAAIGFSLLGGLMAAAAVVGYLVTATAFEGVGPDYFTGPR